MKLKSFIKKKNCKRIFLLLAVGMFTLTNLIAQNQETIEIRGSVIDKTLNETIIGASIVIKGTSIGTITDIDGNFEIKAPANATLVVSFMGYQTKEISVNNQKSLTIYLDEDSKLLQEVVVIGYGTLDKKQVTSSITSVSGKDLVQGVGGSSIATALQGKVGGLVISGTGSPNSGNTLQLRGVASANSGKSPLIVIDGMPGGDIRSVLQEDILSVDVLKDASAGAIYGTRAAGGVILITTKQGQDTGGKFKVTYTGELSHKQATGKPEMLSATEYLEHERGKDYGSSTDWWDELINKNNFSQKHLVNISGGNKNSQIYSTFMYSKDEGIAVEDSRQDYSGRINANFTLMEGWIELKTKTDYRQASRNDNAPNFRQAMINNPTRSPYDADHLTGYNIWMDDDNDYNVLADSKTLNKKGLDKWFKPGVIAKINILPVEGLSIQQSVGYENRQWELHEFRSKWHREEQKQKVGEGTRKGKAYLEFSKTEFLSSEGYASFVRNFKKHSINAVAGYSFFEKNGESFNMTNYNFTNDILDVWDMKDGTYLKLGKGEMNSNKKVTERLFSLFARANYAYDNKYTVMATIRREASSKFAKHNRWGTFWSLSGGWRISDEAFMKNVEFVNDLKFRVGYGVTGNHDFKPEYAATMYSTDHPWLMPDGTWAYSYKTDQILNNDLKWEEKTEWNFGLDYSLFNNRVYGKIDIYRRKVNDLLYNVVVSQPPYVKNKMMKNVGNLENKGWEFEIGGDIVNSKDWKYSSSINLSKNKTTMLNLGSSGDQISLAGFPSPGNPGNAIMIEDGSTLGSFYIWEHAGFDDNGKFLIYDKDGEVKNSDRLVDLDRRQVGNYMPKLIVGWNHSLSYKNWDMSMTLRSWIDFDIYNQVDMYFGLQNEEFNTLKKAYGKYNHVKDRRILTSYFLQDGTFLKIDAINVGYNLNLKKYWKALDKARFYLTVTNVATFTKYDGLNPEVEITGLEGGIDKISGAYPQSRNYTIGAQITF